MSFSILGFAGCKKTSCCHLSRGSAGQRDACTLSLTSTNNPTCKRRSGVSNIRPSGSRTFWNEAVSDLWLRCASGGNRGHFEWVLPGAFRAEPRAPLRDRSTEKFPQRVRSPKNTPTSVKRSRRGAHASKQHAWLPQPANAALPAALLHGYNAREGAHVTPSPNRSLSKQKTTTADRAPFTWDAVEDFAGCCTETSHAVFTELNTTLFFFLPTLISIFRIA